MSKAVKRPARQRSTVAMVFAGAFATSIAAVLFFGTLLPVIVGAPCLVIAAFIDRRIEKQYAKDVVEFRNDNADKFPDVFDVDPLQDLDEVTVDMLDIYDLLTLSFLGSATKSDIAAILKTYDDTPEFLPNGTNDIPYTSVDLECHDAFEVGMLSENFLCSVRPIFDADPKIDLVIRWVESLT